MLGKNLSRYRIVETLGRGGMGVVYGAYDERLHRPVALKALPTEVSGDPDRVRRLLREARAASALDHPGLMTVYDFFAHEGTELIVMERVPGESLRAWACSESGARQDAPWLEATTLALSLAEAVAAAHGVGLVHRDLKPENIMVLPADEEGGPRTRVKVLDFGLATLERGADGDRASQSIAGTPGYMSPEQLLGDPLDTSTDVFSFGIILFELLAGERPFAGGASPEGLTQVLYGRPRPLSDLRPDLPDPLVRLIERCLAKKPAERPALGEIAFELRALLDDRVAASGIWQGGLAALVVGSWPSRPTAENAVGESGGEFPGEALRTVTEEEEPSKRAGPDAEALGAEALDAAALGAETWPLEQDLHRPAAVGVDPGAPPSDSSGELCWPWVQHGGRRIELSGLANGGAEAGAEGRPALLFDHPHGAVRFALAHHRQSRQEGRPTEHGPSRLAIHFTDIGPDFAIEPEIHSLLDGLLSLCADGQTLLTGVAFDLARGFRDDSAQAQAQEAQTADAADGSREKAEAGKAEQASWMAHGPYLVAGLDSPLEIFEVGLPGLSPLSPPADSELAARAPKGDRILGWRPAPGRAIEPRPGWHTVRRLGEGGFGEVWLARHDATREQRVFKFCWEAERLRSLRREILVFRLLKEELGERDDIATVLDWNFDQAPYFIESAYTEGGSLEEWASASGELDSVPLEERLEIIAQVATALSAAHSVGVLHKDVKPANVLMATTDSGQYRAVLADFGIGLITERERLVARGITLPDGTLSADDHTSAGTRLYMAPELHSGRSPTVQSDLYALGICLYQMVVGDLEAPPAAGWERRIEDPVLRQDIASAIDGNPDRRPRSAAELAERLRSLDARREAARREQEERLVAEKAARRRRILTWASSVGLIFLVVVSALAVQAMRARAEAEADRERAEHLVGVMLGDLHDGLEQIGRLDLLETAALGSRAYFDSLPAEAMSAEDRGQRGRTWLHLGDVLRESGNLPDAGSAYASALELFEPRGDGPSVDPEGWQQALLAVGRARRLEGDPRTGLELFGRALDLARGADGESADGVDLGLDSEGEQPPMGLGEARIVLEICKARNQVGETHAAIETCRSVLAGLAGQEGGSRWRRAEVELDTRIMLGGLLRKNGAPEEALAEFGRAEDLARQMIERRPEHAIWARQLAWIRFQVGFVHYYYERDFPKARQVLNQARVAYERLIESDPKRRNWRRKLAEVLNYLGRVELADARPRLAATYFTPAAELLRELMAEDPERLVQHFLAARIEQSIADSRLALGDTAGALEAFRTAVELDRDRAEASTDDPEPQNAMAWGYLEIGRVHARRVEPELARRAWLRADEIMGTVTTHSDAVQYLDTHCQTLLELGEVERARPMAEELLAVGWSDPGFLELVREAGLAAPAKENSPDPE